MENPSTGLNTAVLPFLWRVLAVPLLAESMRYCTAGFTAGVSLVLRNWNLLDRAPTQCGFCRQHGTIEALFVTNHLISANVYTRSSVCTLAGYVNFK